MVPPEIVPLENSFWLTLSLHPSGHDPCGDRAAILEGTWTLVSK